MDLELVEQQFGPIALSEALAVARTYAERSLSDSTRRGYARDLAAFRTLCQARAVAPLPAAPQILAAYLADLAQTDRPATIGRKLAAIAVVHRDAGLESPTEHGMVKRQSNSGSKYKTANSPIDSGSSGTNVKGNSAGQHSDRRGTSAMTGNDA